MPDLCTVDGESGGGVTLQSSWTCLDLNHQSPRSTEDVINANNVCQKVCVGGKRIFVDLGPLLDCSG